MCISLSKYCTITDIKFLLGKVTHGPFSGIIWIYGYTDVIWVCCLLAHHNMGKLGTAMNNFNICEFINLHYVPGLGTSDLVDVKISTISFIKIW